MTTIIDDILRLALKDAGIISIGQTPAPEDINDAFATLKQMIASWQTEKLMIFTQQDVSFPVMPNKQIYTVGTGGDVDIPRPNRIDGMFWRMKPGDPTPVDYHIAMFSSFEDYENLTLKTLTGPGFYAYYRPSFPLGNLYVMPQPSEGDFHIVVRERLPEYATIFEDMALPPEYALALRFNLGALLAITFQTTLRPDLVDQARITKAKLKTINHETPVMQMPANLLGGLKYNIYGDNVY